MSQTHYRQGDVLILRVNSVPDGLKVEPRDNGRVILAYGEVTGHAHAIADHRVSAAQAAQAAENAPFRLRVKSALFDIAQTVIAEPAGVFAWASASLRTILGWLGAVDPATPAAGAPATVNVLSPSPPSQ